MYKYIYILEKTNRVFIYLFQANKQTIYRWHYDFQNYSNRSRVRIIFIQDKREKKYCNYKQKTESSKRKEEGLCGQIIRYF
jgi:hypothetical protein